MSEGLLRFIAYGRCAAQGARCICRAFHEVVFFRVPVLPPLHEDCHCTMVSVDREILQRASIFRLGSDDTMRFAALPDLDGFLYRRKIQEQGSEPREVGVIALLFGAARLGVSAAGASGFEDVWDYPSVARAIVAAAAWNPAEEAEPDGWIRHPASGRRRVDGDPRRESR